MLSSQWMRTVSLLLYRYHDDGDEPEIEYIDDEDELNAASDCFDEWLDEQEFLDSDE